MPGGGSEARSGSEWRLRGAANPPGAPWLGAQPARLRPGPAGCRGSSSVGVTRRTAAVACRWRPGSAGTSGGGLARTSARRSGVGRGASVRSIQHGLGTQRAPSRLPPARPSSCPGPLPRSRLTATFHCGGILGTLGTGLQSQALWPFCPSGRNLWPTGCKDAPQLTAVALGREGASEGASPRAGPERGGQGPQLSRPPDRARAVAAWVSVTAGPGELLGAGGGGGARGGRDVVSGAEQKSTKHFVWHRS